MVRLLTTVACLAILLGRAPDEAFAQTQVFVRVGGGTLNPDDPFATTLAYGAAAGVTVHASSFLVRLVRQSRNGNSGSDISNARTYALLDWEPTFRPAGQQQRQPFLRLGAGWLWRKPFASTWVVDLGAGLRYRLAPHLFVVGSVVDQMAKLPYQTYVTCYAGQPPAGVCVTNEIKAELQQNFGLLVDLEARL
jgi:hypothetical protein